MTRTTTSTTSTANPTGAPTGPSSLPGPRAPWAPPVRPQPDPPYTQGSLALSYPLPSGLDSVPHARSLAVVTPPVRGDDSDVEAPPAEGWAARFVQAVVEVMTGDRPLTQLIRWTDEAVYAEIDQRLGAVQSRRATVPARSCRQRVATVHVCQLSAGRAEVAARVTNGRRSRAIAARLELHRGRWVCTAIQFG